MAENSTKAFGRYLKALRERRDLSLDEVASLSQTFPEKINKGYLSRCENGHQKLGFSKVIALSRIYEVPADVLVERMELDLELDRVGGPDTEGKTFAELTEAGKKAMQEGLFWNAFGYLRDAVHVARNAPLKSNFRDQPEQAAVAHVNYGTAARALGRYRLALHEFLFVDSKQVVTDKYHALLLERISCCYCRLQQLDRAESYADRAISEAETAEDREYVGYLYANRASIALERHDYPRAADLYQQAHRLHKEAGQISDCASSLNRLAQCYVRMNRLRAARLACEGSEKIASANNRARSRAFATITLGEIDEAEGNPQKAIKRWRHALSIAKTLNDRELRFKSELMLYRRALKDGKAPVARAIQRRLEKQSPGIAPDTEELVYFKRLVSMGSTLD